MLVEVCGFLQQRFHLRQIDALFARCVYARAAFLTCHSQAAPAPTVVENPLFNTSMRMTTDDIVAGFSNPHYVSGACALL